MLDFDELYEREAERVLGYFVRRTFDVESARDLTAETFARAFEHRARFRGEGVSQATAWLYGIAGHLLGSYIRRGIVQRKATRRLGIQIDSVVAADEYDRIVELAGLHDVRAAVSAALETLDADHRRALELRVVAQLPYGDVARSLGTSEQSARARVSRALRRLTDALEISDPGGLPR
jgi:RNA polymerase sigma factor (sigma-70 family)